MSRTAYLANKMRGKPLYGFQWFEDTKHDLVSKGWTIISPHDIDINERRAHIEAHINGEQEWYRRVFDKVEFAEDFSLQDTLRQDFRRMLDCDAVILGPDWRDSAGARMERAIAHWAGLDVYEYANGVLLLDEDHRIEA